MNYAQIAKGARKKVLQMIFEAQSSHIGSNFSCIDILSVLFEQMNLEQDEFIASKGWVAASVYYFLSEKGIIPKEDLERYCKEGETKYIGLIEPHGVFGMKAAGGSMGMGLAFGVGFALAKKLKKELGNIYVLIGDGEMDCGTTWEAALIAAAQKLDNLIVIIDRNRLQGMGKTEDILPKDPVWQKWEAFGWSWNELDGHDTDYMSRAFANTPIRVGRPTVHIANTTKGKGVSFMENVHEWHYRAPEPDEYEQALKELA